MFQILGNLGWLIRISIALAFAAFWGYLAWTWNEMGEAGPGKPTVIGVAVLAGLAGLSGLVGLVRMVTSTASVAMPTPRPSESITPEQRDLDADAIIARYMARREEEGAAPIAPEPTEPPATNQRPQFGRKNL